MSAKLAIIGAGPAGFYAADALLRKLPDARIDIYDRLALPHGLVRYGVAPDHLGTRAIARVFNRILQKPGVRFVPDVTVGRDTTLAALRGAHDAVVLAVGCPRDRRLGIPGEDLPGVYGSAAFVGWYNGHPDHAALDPDLSGVRSAVVIGNGNVAIDVVRVLAKSPAEMIKAELAPAVAARLHAAPLQEIHLAGRRGPLEANFTNLELSELGKLERAAPAVNAADLPADAGSADKVKQANLATLHQFAAARADKPIRIRFRFQSPPLAILGRERVEAVRFADGDVPAQLVVTCIGYRGIGLEDVPFDEARGIVRNDRGRVAPGLYVTGWAMRGPSGTIPTNRTDGLALAELVAADLAERRA